MIYLLFFLLFMLVPIMMLDLARDMAIAVMEAFDF